MYTKEKGCKRIDKTKEEIKQMDIVSQDIDRHILEDQLIRKLNRDIQRSTGLDVTDKKINLHEFEKRYGITIKAPKRDLHGKLGYHKHRLYEFKSPIERMRINKIFDDDFGIETGEYEFSSE